MGNTDSKLHFRKAVIQLTTKTQPVEATDDAFWDQFWADTATSIQDVFTLVPAAEIRAVREESPSNLATLCYKAVEKLVQGAESGCASDKEKQIIINCTQLLTRILPYIFEDPDWRGFFWSTVPGAGRDVQHFQYFAFPPQSQSPLCMSQRSKNSALTKDQILQQANVDCGSARVGLMHIGVFILLLLSGERNFGVRLNKPYSVRVPMDIPVFTGTHADLLIIVFHKIITSGHQRLQPLFDCLLTIVVNVSPYLKSLSMVAANKLLHLLEAFSTTWFLFTASQNHHLVFFLLEVFNNIIQYQFDGNSNLVYAIIRKRNVFHQLANLPTDPAAIQKALQKKKKSTEPISRTNSQEGVSMEGSRPAAPAEPGTLKTSLIATPGIDKLTEKSQVSEDGTLSRVDQGQDQAAPPAEEHPVTLASDTESSSGGDAIATSPCRTFWEAIPRNPERRRKPSSLSSASQWTPSPDWVISWKSKLPLQTIMRLLQVLVPQVEKICIDKGLTDESEILKFLQHGTLVGLLPVPHPILIRKYQANSGTAMWFRTYMWGVIYLRNVDPPIWYDTDVKLFEIQRV
ncbi:protein HID1-like [Mustelus asterias]